MDVERIEASRSIDPDLVSSLATDIDNGSATCAVVGLGLIGTLSLRGVIKAGFRAIGYDREKSAVERFRRSCQYVGQPYDWMVSSDSSVLALANVAITVVRGNRRWMPVTVDRTAHLNGDLERHCGLSQSVRRSWPNDGDLRQAA
jgi:hypothetical protein